MAFKWSIKLMQVETNPRAQPVVDPSYGVSSVTTGFVYSAFNGFQSLSMDSTRRQHNWTEQ